MRFTQNGRRGSRRSRSLASLLVWLAIWGFCFSALGSDAARPLQEGQSALETGRAEAAEALFRQALALDSDLLPAYWGLGQSLQAQGRNAEALAIYTQLGDGLLRAGVDHEAGKALEKAIALAPERGELWAMLGRVASLEQRYDAATGHLGRAVELGHADLRTLLYLGAAQWESGDVEAAEATYRRALALGNPLPAHQLGRLLLWQGRHTEAVETLRNAASRLTDAADLQLDLARALLADGRIAAAIHEFQEAVRLAPSRSHAHYGLAQALARHGEREAAAREIAVYRELYEQEQQRVREQELAKARLGKGWELLRAGDGEGAYSLFSKLPATADSLFGLAEAQLATGRARAAIASLEQAVTLAPERGDLRLRLAEARFQAAEGS